MDSLKGAFNSFSGGNGNQQAQGQQIDQSGAQQQQGGGGFLGGMTDKFNSAAGGGRESEKNEDYLDKGVDFVQERFMGQGAQNNESAIEQAKDEQISDVSIASGLPSDTTTCMLLCIVLLSAGNMDYPRDHG